MRTAIVILLIVLVVAVLGVGGMMLWKKPAPANNATKPEGEEKPTDASKQGEQPKEQPKTKPTETAKMEVARVQQGAQATESLEPREQPATVLDNAKRNLAERSNMTETPIAKLTQGEQPKEVIKDVRKQVIAKVIDKIPVVSLFKKKNKSMGGVVFR